MPPQQSYGQPSSHGSDPYVFILNSGQKRGVPLLGGSGSNRLLLIVGGAFLLIIVAWVVLSIVKRSPHVDSVSLIAIAQKQTELARVSEETRDLLGSQSTRNFAITTKLNMLTEQQRFESYLTKRGVAVPAKIINATQSSQTDRQLQTAQANGNYDQTYLDIAQNQLASYERSLADEYKLAPFNSEKQLLQTAYNESQLLDAFAKQ